MKKGTLALIFIALFISPDFSHAQLGGLLNKVKKSSKKKKESKADLESVESESDFHKNHLHKVVWSSKPLTIGQETQTDIKTSFKSNELIYGTVYLAKTLREEQGSPALIGYEFSIVGGNGVTYICEMYASTEMKKYNYLQFVLVPDMKTYDAKVALENDNNSLVRINKALSEAPQSKHTINFEIEFDGTNREIESSFDIDFSAGKAFYENNHHKLNELHVGAVKLPVGGMQNSALEQEIVKITNAADFNSWDLYDYKRAVIISKDWLVSRHRVSGVILGKYVNAYVTAKREDGTCAYQKITFYKDYDGSKYGKLYLSGRAGEPKGISCNNY